ncbi:tetratricopeptide repeat protein, partial [Mesorhizobium sp. M2C.T.Ca.TU.009.01.2.1]
LDDCIKAIKLDPKASRAFFCSGAAWYGTGDPKRAIEAFSSAIEIDPRYAASYYGRGMARLDVKNYADATADFDQAAKLDPHNPNYAAARKAATAAQQKGGMDGNSIVPSSKELAAFVDRGYAFYH